MKMKKAGIKNEFLSSIVNSLPLLFSYDNCIPLFIQLFDKNYVSVNIVDEILKLIATKISDENIEKQRKIDSMKRENENQKEIQNEIDNQKETINNNKNENDSQKEVQNENDNQKETSNDGQNENNNQKERKINNPNSEIETLDNDTISNLSTINKVSNMASGNEQKSDKASITNDLLSDSYDDADQKTNTKNSIS